MTRLELARRLLDMKCEFSYGHDTDENIFDCTALVRDLVESLEAVNEIVGVQDLTIVQRLNAPTESLYGAEI